MCLLQIAPQKYHITLNFLGNILSAIPFFYSILLLRIALTGFELESSLKGSKFMLFLMGVMSSGWGRG